MIFDIKNTKGKKALVYDAQGTIIGSCFKYNSKTREVSMFLTGKHPSERNKSILMKSIKPKTKGELAWATMKVTVKIPGSYIIIDGVKY